MNIYFPTDPRVYDFDDTDLQLLLSQIKETIDINVFDILLLAGDMNTDFGRSTHFVEIVTDFITETGLSKAWDSYPIDFTHIYERDEITFTSTIDHFLGNISAKSHIIDAGVIHLPENMSDHEPIYCKITVPTGTQKI